MPALTHNRVKNGFNGGIRKKNATAGTKFARTLGSSKADATRSKALVGDIGSMPPNIRAAYRRRVLCKCDGSVKDRIKPIISAINQITSPTTDSTPSFDFSSNEVGIISSNYAFTSTKNAVIGLNTITFSQLATGTYSDIWIRVTDKTGNVSDKLMLDSFVLNDAVPPVIVAVAQVTTLSNDSTPSFVFSSDEVGTITSSIAFTSSVSAIVGNNTITFASLADGTYSGVTVEVTDATGNVSNQLTLADFTIDTTSPVLAVVTQVTTLSNDTTPSFTISSTKAGNISSNYTITPGTVSQGNNTLTFAALADGTYSGVTIEVTDAAGNVSNQLTLADFTIDTTGPTLAAVTQVTTLSNDTTPSFVFSSNEVGTITSSIAFTSSVNAVVGNNTLTFAALTDGTYSGVTVEVTDAAGNVSNQLTLADFTVDTAAPTLTAVAQVTATSNDTTPSFTFNSNEAGDISSNYTFTSSNAAIVGDNTITFATLADGTYSDVVVEVTDAAGNVSNSLTLTAFTIDTGSGVLQLVTPVDSLSNNTTPSFDINSNEAGDISSNYTFTTTTVSSGNNTLTFNSAFSYGKYDDVQIQIVDSLGNKSNTITLDAFEIRAVILAEEAPVLNSINPTPEYKFTSDKVGTISSNYEFTSSDAAVVGSNKLVFSSLKEGAYNDIWVKVTDSNSDESNELIISPFVVEKPDLADKAGLSQTNNGILYIEGDTMEGSTLSTSVVDNDGGGYLPSDLKWYRVTGEEPTITEQEIATGTSYVLTNDDVGKRIKASLTYTDGLGNIESMKTWPTAVISERTTFTVDAGSGSYRIDTHGTTNHPTLTLERGFTYTITLNASGHPFRIQTDEALNGTLFNDGLSHNDGTNTVTGSSAQNKDSGTLSFKVPFDAPDKLYYRCQVHSAMKGIINVVSTKIKFYYEENPTYDLKPIIDKSSKICNSIINRYKKDYNIIIKILPSSDFSSANTIANASYQSQVIKINEARLDLIQQGTLNDQVIESFTNTMIHELFHIFELIGNKDSSLLDSTNHLYVGTEGLTGYKNLVTANQTDLQNAPYSMTISVNDLSGVPIEDDFGEGTELYHWEEGLDNNYSDEPRTINSVRFPILRNEIMTGLKTFNAKYLTEMTAGALKDVGHHVNDSSVYISNTGTNMEWK